MNPYCDSLKLDIIVRGCAARWLPPFLFLAIVNNVALELHIQQVVKFT
jgi:hypothetical protein